MQAPEELLSLPEQQLMLETIMLSPDDRSIDVAALKKVVKERAPEATDDAAYDRIEAELLDAYGAKPLASSPSPEGQAESPDSQQQPPADKPAGETEEKKDA
jgi:hypothetical protein